MFRKSSVRSFDIQRGTEERITEMRSWITIRSWSVLITRECSKKNADLIDFHLWRILCKEKAQWKWDFMKDPATTSMLSRALHLRNHTVDFSFGHRIKFKSKSDWSGPGSTPSRCVQFLFASVTEGRKGVWGRMRSPHGIWHPYSIDIIGYPLVYHIFQCW